MATETKIEIRTVGEWNDLFCQYSGQFQQQDCFVELDCGSGILRAAYNCEIGNAVPFSVWHGHDRRYCIPCLTADAANSLLEELAPLAQRVVDGYTSEWDGSNHVARFTEDARLAEEEIEAAIESHHFRFDDGDLVGCMEAGDWLNLSAGIITADTTDEEITKCTEEYESMAAAENIVLRGTMEHLEFLRDQARHAAE